MVIFGFLQQSRPTTSRMSTRRTQQEPPRTQLEKRSGRASRKQHISVIVPPAAGPSSESQSWSIAAKTTKNSSIKDNKAAKKGREEKETGSRSIVVASKGKEPSNKKYEIVSS